MVLKSKPPRPSQKPGFREWFLNIIPLYSFLPLALMVSVNLIAFYGTRLFTANAYHYDIALSVDGKIPFFTPAIVIYIASYIQWVVGYVAIARESREVCNRFIYGEIIAKVICAVIFLAFPTATVRPEVPDGGVFNWLTALIYSLDKPDNLFPSLHCLESYFCMRGAFYCRKTPKWFAPVNVIFTLMVFACILLVKQHVLLDIPSAIIVAEIGMFAMRAIEKKKHKTLLSD